MGTTVVFYDGVCGMCDRFVQFLLRHDRAARFRFAPLQGQLARTTLTSRGFDPSSLETVYVIADWGTPRERVLDRSQAILHAVAQLNGRWQRLAQIGRIVPRPLADRMYRLVSRARYRISGQTTSCPLPTAEWRERSLQGEE